MCELFVNSISTQTNWKTNFDITCTDESSKKHPHAASLIIQPSETSEFHVVYTASAAGRSAAQVRITVTDNQFENQLIQIVGEGYHDDVTLDNIHSLVTEESIEGMVEDEQIAGRNAHLDGTCKGL